VPDRAAAHFNFASALISAHRSMLGVREINRAMELGTEKDLEWIALMIRGQGKLNLGDPDGALDDAKKSFAMHADANTVVLFGDIADAQNDKPKAVEFWLQAYKLGQRDDSMMDRLKRAGVTPPAD